MRHILLPSTTFIRAAKRMAKRHAPLADEIDSALRQLQADPYHPSLRTHKLKG